MPLEPTDELEDDTTLAGRMASGDEHAFATLFCRYQGPVYRFARQMGGSPEVAEDVTQDVFIALMDSGRRFDPGLGSLRVYLYGIARNLLRRHLRKRAAHPEVDLERLADGKPEATVVTADALADLERAEAVALLRRAIVSLPAHYREVIVLCDLHELRYEDAALVAGCPIGTVRSRLSRARRVLARRCRAEAGTSALADAACAPRRCLA